MRLQSRMLQRILHVTHYTNRQVSICFQHFDAFSTYQHRSIMTSIAIVQIACSKIQHPYKHGYKHVIVILLLQNDIDVFQYL